MGVEGTFLNYFLGFSLGLRGGVSGGLWGMEGADVHLGAFGCLWSFGQTFERVSQCVKSFSRLKNVP